jgi:hypothetical protein
LVASSEKHEQLWQAKSAKDRTFFNEHYALHNILHSGDSKPESRFYESLQTPQPSSSFQL